MEAHLDPRWERQIQRALAQAGMEPQMYSLPGGNRIALHGDWRTILDHHADALADNGVAVRLWRLQPGDRAVGYYLSVAPPGALGAASTTVVADIGEVPEDCR